MKAIIVLATLTIIEKIDPSEPSFTKKDYMYLKMASIIIIERSLKTHVKEYTVLKNGNIVLRFPENIQLSIVRYEAALIKNILEKSNAKVGHVIITASEKKFIECCKKHS